MRQDRTCVELPLGADQELHEIWEAYEIEQRQTKPLTGVATLAAHAAHTMSLS